MTTRKPATETFARSLFARLLPRLTLVVKDKKSVIGLLIVAVLAVSAYGLYERSQVEKPLAILVDVTGAVKNPGVYELPEGSRLQDAVDAAGGLTTEADSSGFNRAQLLTDGMRVFVPAVPAQAAPDGPANVSPDGLPDASQPTAGDPATSTVNINTADAATLQTLEGVGPVTAQNIIAYRNQYGAFAKVEDLMKVPDIGEKTFAKLKEHISV
jgi:competence protein ComEA